ILLVGLCFALGVFLTYLALGMGALKAIQLFSVSNNVSKIITYAAAAFAFVLGAVSLRDYVVYRRTGKPSSMKLGLPKPIKTKIHDVMRSKLSTQRISPHRFNRPVRLVCLVILTSSGCTPQILLSARLNYLLL
ncbi:hypothetical protein LCGC14_1830240, partial [marine sediment metagenome]